MIGFDEAVERLRSVARPLGSELVALDRARGRVLAASVIARIDSPRSDVSVMDGYAVREADLSNFPVSLKVIGESFPGTAWNGAVAPGTCVRIFTGAPVPAGADRVVIQENVRRDGADAIIAEPPGEARHIRARASDFFAGEELLPAQRLLDPRALVAAAAADVAELELYRRPRLHLLSTGDELAEPGIALEHPDAIPESASYAVVALSEQWGAEYAGRTRLADDLATMRRMAELAIGNADVVVVIGGASVGDRDFAKAMFEPLGAELVFSTVSIKPGKPVWLGRVCERLVIGLPGNPTSALVTARLFLAPILAGLTGRSIEAPLSWRSVELGNAIPECGARETFHRGRWRDGAVWLLPNQDSGSQRALADADLLVRQRSHSPALGAGTTVEVLNF